MDDPKANAGSEPPPGHIDSLPTEVKTEIVRYLHLARDKKALSLTSKSWAWISLPILWETLRSDFIMKNNRDLHDITHLDSNIIKHVKHIYVSKEPYCEDDDRFDAGTAIKDNEIREDCLPVLLAFLPRDRIHKFASWCSQRLHVLTVLLQLHKIEHLEVPLESWKLLIQNTYTLSRLSGLKDLALDADSENLSGAAGDLDLGIIGAACPELVNLEIHGARGCWLPGLFLSSDGHDGRNSPRAIEQLKVSRLIIRDTTLEDWHHWNGFNQCIDLLRLHTLELLNVNLSTDILEELAAVFKSGKAQLQILRLLGRTDLWGSELSGSVLQDFLFTFNGLRLLHLQHPSIGRLDPSSITNHPLLEDLYLVNGGLHRTEPRKIFNASNWQNITTGCPQIKYMCLNICELEGSGELSGGLNRPQSTEFEGVLKALARLSHLRVLCMTNPIYYHKALRSQRHGGQNYTDYFNRGLEFRLHDADFRLLAQRVIQYLREHRSNLEVLVFAPVEDLPKPDEGFEDHGRFWPYYGFLREQQFGPEGKDVITMKTRHELQSQFSEVALFKEMFESLERKEYSQRTRYSSRMRPSWAFK